MKIPSHLETLNEAWKWRTDNTQESRNAACAVLVEGMNRFPDALSLGEELVLLHKENGDYDLAIELLRELGRRFRQVGEETLCRWGSVLRQRGIAALDSHSLGAAEADLREAEGYFSRAFEEFGTHYPRINQLTTRFARAGLAKALGDESKSTNLLLSVDDAAKSFLNDDAIWARLKPHDSIWAWASRGEACLLLSDWPAAEMAYSEAIHAAGDAEFPRQSMAKQIRVILIPAFGRLGRKIQQKLADPDTFFGINAEAQS